MAYDKNKLARLKALEDLADQIKGKFATKAELSDLSGSMPTKVSDLTNDSGFQTEEQVAAKVAAAEHLKRKKVASKDAIDPAAAGADQYIYMVPKTGGKNGDKYDEYMVLDGAVEPVGDWTVDLSGYVEKETGKGLSSNDYTGEEKAKLAGLQNYTHPAHTAKSSGLYKITVDALGHVSAATAVAKADITGLGIPAQDTTYSAATASADGLMSSADKAKLDDMDVATDAEVAEMLTAVFGA